jgi:hypothetical protein
MTTISISRGIFLTFNLSIVQQCLNIVKKIKRQLIILILISLIVKLKLLNKRDLLLKFNGNSILKVTTIVTKKISYRTGKKPF